MDLRWDVLLAVVLGPDAEDWDAGDDPDDPGRPTGVRARSLYLMATSWPDHPDLPELAGRMVCDVDDEVRDIACATVEGFAADARLDDRVVRAVAAAAGQDDDGTGARELVTMLAEMWQPEPDRFPLMAALVDLAVPEPGGTDRADSVSAVAVRALADGWRRDPRTLPLLGRVLEQHPVAAARAAALDVLVGSWSDDPSVARLVQTAAERDPDAGVRAEALRLVRLRFAGGSDAVALLAQAALHDRSPDARVQALHALGEEPRHGAVAQATLEVLLRAVHDRSPEVRTAALDVVYAWPDALADVGWLTAAADEDPDAMVRAAAVRAFVRHGGSDPSARHRVEAYLRDDDPDVRVAALRGLTRQDPSSVEPLAEELRRIAESDPWFRARQVAGQVLSARTAP